MAVAEAGDRGAARGVQVFLAVAVVDPDALPANGYGLYDMAGNVWEWTTDFYGGTEEASLDPGQPQFRVPRRVVKGGSFLCADSYCCRYRPAARRPQMVDTGMSHIGFRCVADVPPH